MAIPNLRSNRTRDLDRIKDEFDGAHKEEGDDDQTVRYTVIALSVFLGATLTFWLAVQIASLLHGFDWIPPAEGLKATPLALIGLVEHFAAPSLGYPPALRPQVAPAWLIYPLLALILSAEVRYGLRAKRWYGSRKSDQDHGGTQWAQAKELEEISNPKKNPDIVGGVVLGISAQGKQLFLERQSHALVVAGTRSGKTAGLCTPALLTFPGVVIATSVKNDLVKNTLRRRRELGDVYLFDPVGAIGLDESELAGWTPLAASREWRGAQRTASSLIDASSKGGAASANAEFFKQMGLQTLPVILYAAAVMNEDMRRVVHWLHMINDKQTHAEVDAILRFHKNSRALEAWIGFVTKEPKLRGDIAATIAGALISYEDEKVQKNAMRCDITPEKLFNGGANTLYVCAPMAEQARLEPVFVALLESLLLWVTEQPQPLEVPLLAVLDEAGNIAAMPRLPEILSTIGSQNVSIISSWQDFSQISNRYGEKKNTILNNSRGKLVLPGVGDPETIRYFGEVTGDTVERQVSISGADSRRGVKARRQVSVGEGRRALLTASAIREQKVGEAVLVYGNLPPAKIKLRMYYKDPELKALVSGVPRTAASLGKMALKRRIKR